MTVNRIQVKVIVKGQTLNCGMQRRLSRQAANKSYTRYDYHTQQVCIFQKMRIKHNIHVIDKKSTIPKSNPI